jgi:hypothetical protein
MPACHARHAESAEKQRKARLGPSLLSVNPSPTTAPYLAGRQVGNLLPRDGSLHRDVGDRELPMHRLASPSTKPGVRLRSLGDSPVPHLCSRYWADGHPDRSLSAEQDANVPRPGRTLAVDAPPTIRDHAPSRPVQRSDNRHGEGPWSDGAAPGPVGSSHVQRTADAYRALPGLARACAERVGRCRGRGG